MGKMRSFILLVIVFLTEFVFAQNRYNEIDSIIECSPMNEIKTLLYEQKLLSKTQGEILINKVNYSSYYIKLRRFDTALLYLDTAKVFVKSMVDSSVFFQKKAQIFYEKEMYQDALLLYNKAESISSKDYYNLAKVNYGKYKVYKGLNNNSKALFKLKLSKSYFLKSKKIDKNYANVLNSLGINYYKKAKYDSAFLYYLKSLTIYEESNDIYNVARTKDLIGTIFYKQKKYKEALNSYLSSYDLYVILNDFEEQCGRLSNIGAIYSDMEKLDSAFYYHNKVYKLAIENKYNYLESIALSNLALVEGNRGDLNKAIDYQRKSILIDYQRNDINGLTISYYNLGDLFLLRNDRLKALKNFHNSLFYSNINGTRDLTQLCYEKISQLHEGFNDDSALVYYKKFTALKDSIEGVSVKKSIQKINVKYTNKLTIEENRRLKIELKHKEQDIVIKKQESNFQRTRFNFLFVISFLFIIILVLTIYFNRKNAKKRLELISLKIEQEENQRKVIEERLELTQKAIKQKNNTIIKLNKFVESPNTKKELLENLSTERDWVRFIIDFEILYPEFYKNLALKKDAKLTNNDRRIAALCHLNLTNKEISNILCISLSGVKNAKSRFNSKLINA